MTGWSVLLLGVGLGLRHATDADHVVVVSALVQREPGLWKAARLATLWGAGHTAAFLGLGLLVVLAGIHPPPAFERGTELLVGAMLVGFGAWHLAQHRRAGTEPGHAHRPSSYARPVLIGLVHGLAGSAGVALLAASTIASRPLAAAYLGLFGFGTILGMVALTLLIARPIDWTMRRGGRSSRALTFAAALLSVGLGAVIGFEGLTTSVP